MILADVIPPTRISEDNIMLTIGAAVLIVGFLSWLHYFMTKDKGHG